MKKTIAVIFGLLSLSIANSQLDQVSNMLKTGIQDANKLTSAYLSPFGKGFAYNLSSGWFNTANTHSILGFDINLTTNVAIVPSNLKTFDLSTLNLSNAITYSSPSESPTIAGKNVSGPQVTYNQNITLPDNTQQVASTSFKLPKGLNVAFVPLPMIQAGIGLPKGTDLMGRYLPTIKIGSYGKLGLWGIGIKHDIKQWIPVLSKTPFWSMSGLISYTNFVTSVKGTFLKPDPAQFYLTGVDINNDYNNQGIELNASALNASLLISTNIPVINIYGGVGILSAKSKLKMTGKYPVPDTPNANDVQNSFNNGESVKLGVKNITDPIDATLTSGTHFKYTIGLRLKLALLTIHADYSEVDKFKLISSGIGISFR